MNRTGRAIAIAAATVLAWPLAAAADAQGEVAEQGELSGGAAYALLRPADWNGDLVIMPGRARLDAGITEWLADAGYGLVGYALSDDWDLEQDRDNASEAWEAFVDATGAVPEASVVAGRSQGGLTTRIVVDAAPSWLDGAMPMCGGGAGNVSTWNYKLDTGFALRELVDPSSPMQITDIDDRDAELAAMTALVAEAGETDEGRARAALAAAMAKIPAVDPETGREIDRRDLDARIDRYLEHLPFAMGSHVRYGYEQTVGGTFSWNTDVDYAQRLRESGRYPEVAAAYRAAGLSLADDLATLAAAERISADPDVVSFVERTSTYTGDLAVPVLSLHTTGDGAGSTQDDDAYAEVVRAAGSASMLRTTTVASDGHCTFTAAEEAAALDALFERIRDGRWPSTAPTQLDARAERLAGETGDARFVHQPRQGTPARTWDVRDWGAYTG